MPVRLADGQADDPSCQRRDDGYPALPGSKDEADAARALRAFLVGFGIGPGEGCEQLVERLLPGACARRRAHPKEDPGACAILHAEEAFESWLTAVLGAERLAGHAALPIGRAAFFACDGPARWQHLILVHDPLPEAFVAAMHAAAPPLAPMPTPGTMATQSLERWTIADAGRVLAEVLDANRAWQGYARPLIAVPIKLGRLTQ